MSFSIKFTHAASRQFENLPHRVQKIIAEAINSLADNPHPNQCRKIKGIKNLWRLKIGNYRVIYTIRETLLLVIIVRVANRKEVYMRLNEL